jgi:hypothetical protein
MEKKEWTTGPKQSHGMESSSDSIQSSEEDHSKTRVKVITEASKHATGNLAAAPPTAPIQMENQSKSTSSNTGASRNPRDFVRLTFEFVLLIAVVRPRKRSASPLYQIWSFVLSFPVDITKQKSDFVRTPVMRQCCLWICRDTRALQLPLPIRAHTLYRQSSTNILV